MRPTDVAAAIDQNQGAITSKVTKVQQGQTTHTDEAAGRVFRRLAVLERRNIGEEVDDIALAGSEDFLTDRLLQRRGSRLRVARDKRTGDDDLPNLIGFGRLRLRQHRSLDRHDPRQNYRAEKMLALNRVPMSPTAKIRIADGSVRCGIIAKKPDLIEQGFTLFLDTIRI